MLLLAILMRDERENVFLKNTDMKGRYKGIYELLCDLTGIRG